MTNQSNIISTILKEALDRKASDIILSADSYPSLKIDGDIVYLTEYDILEGSIFKNQVLSIMTKTQQERFNKNMELDFSIALGERRFRVNAFMGAKGYVLVFRPIVSEVPSFDSLGLPGVIKRFADKKSGLVLITGAVGTGKSTTMLSLINEINKKDSRHIITVEDPIEYIFKNEKSLIEQREVGASTLSFENALKYSLRQASDVLMIGEMRDLETFRLALRAAETGNLVFATLHTSGATRTVARIVDMFPANEKEQVKAQLSESLVGVVWQKLIRKADGKGRTAAIEIMLNTTSISNTIRKGDNHQLDGIIETSSKDGMISMRRYLELLMKKGIISEEKFDQEIKTLGNDL